MPRHTVAPLIAILLSGCVVVEHALDLGTLIKIEKNSEPAKNSVTWSDAKVNFIIKGIANDFKLKSAPTIKVVSLDHQKTEIVPGVTNTLYLGSEVKRAYESGALSNEGFVALMAHEISHLAHEDALHSISSKNPKRVGVSIPNLKVVAVELGTTFIAYKLMSSQAVTSKEKFVSKLLGAGIAYNAGERVLNELKDPNSDVKVYYPTSHSLLHNETKEHRADCESIDYLKSRGKSSQSLVEGLLWLNNVRMAQLRELKERNFSNDLKEPIEALEQSITAVFKRIELIKEPNHVCS
jgi:hypothetical protein